MTDSTSAYIQLGDRVFEQNLGSLEDKQKWQELVKHEEERQSYQEILALKLKASGKELDPRWFNEEEVKAFQDSDRVEWEAWINNGVARRLSSCEASKVPSSAILKIPLRVVRVNKSKDPQKLQAKKKGGHSRSHGSWSGRI